MKYSNIFLAFLFTVASAIATAQGFLSPMNEIEFRQRLIQLQSQPGGDEAKLRTFRQFIYGKSLTSQQVKQFATTMVSDFVRFQLALDAYNITSDKQNFYDVYDAFATMSAAFRLHDAVNAPTPPPVVVQPNNPLPPQKPNVNYPNSNNYNGVKGCNQPLSDGDFNYYSNTIFTRPNDGEKMEAARELMKNNCITFSHLMQIVFSFNLDGNRLEFMRRNLPRVYDLENYNYATAVFTNDYQKNDWLNFARTYLNGLNVPPPPPVVICEVPGNELEEIKTTIKKQSFSTTMKSVAQQILSSKKCFSCNQVKQIAGLFSFEEDKLEVIKFAYDYTTDKQNFYTLVDVLKFSGSKEDLMNFINLKK